MISLFAGREFDGNRVGADDGTCWEVVAPAPWQLGRWCRLLRAGERGKATFEVAVLESPWGSYVRTARVTVYIVPDRAATRELGIPRPGSPSLRSL